MSNPSNTDPTTFTELFRAALMRKHSDEWDMETVSEAAHICAAVASQAIAEAVEAERREFAEWAGGWVHAAVSTVFTQINLKGKGHAVRFSDRTPVADAIQKLVGDALAAYESDLARRNPQPLKEKQ